MKTLQFAMLGFLKHRFATAKIFAVLMLLAFSVQAQPTNTIRFRIHQTRFTVPAGSVTSGTSSNWVAVGSLGGSPVTVSVSGLPSGASASVSLDNSTFSSSVSTLDSTNIFLKVDTTGALAKGIYTFSLNGAGGNENVTNYILLNLQSGILDDLFSAGSSDDVILGENSGAADGTTITHTISTDKTVGSLRFNQTNGNRFHYISIDPGKRLSITGTNGFSMLRDFVEENGGGNLNLGGMTVTVVGTNATMLVSNSAANFAVLIPADNVHTLNMAALDNLIIKVNRIGLGDYDLWPNFWSLDANEYNGIPRRLRPTVNFARTNVIMATFVDPYNYTNSESRNYGLTYMNSVYSGTTAVAPLRLGQTNAFLMDGFCFVHANQQSIFGSGGGMSFNTFFSSNNQCYAYFRNTNGGRMTMFAIADGGTTNAGASNIKAEMNFGAGGGSVDILTERFYISRDRKAFTAAGQPNYQGDFIMGKGVVDANAAILGFQEQCCPTNLTEYRGYCVGRLIVSNTAVFRVNGTLTLGYTTASNILALPYDNVGRVTVSGGGTVSANNVAVGGSSKGFSTTEITVNSGSTLIVSNTVAGADQKLTTLSMSGGNLVLNITGLNTNIFVTNLTASLPDNTVSIGSVSGIGSSYPVVVPLISYDVNNSANFTIGTLPIVGNQLYGSIADDAGNKLITLTLDTNPPVPLVWRGNLSGDWDLSTSNWVVQGTSTPQRFHNGDFVIFEDNAPGSTEINIASTVTPGQSPTTPGILISNSVKNYTFNGSGPISGSASTRKVGTAAFTNNTTMQGSVTIDAGSLAGSGAVGTTTVNDGARLTAFTGTINGGLTTSNGNVSVLGTVNSSLTLRSGSMTNNGTISGTLSIRTNTFLTNGVGATINVNVPWTIQSNATVVNNGTIAQTAVGTSQGLTVNGNLRGTGKLDVVSGAIANARVTFGPGGRLDIGNTPGEITTMTIATRLDFQAGATTTIDVDTSTTNDTILLDESGVSSGKVNFGQNSSPGGVFIINKTGGPAFTTNTVLHFFDKTLNPTPDNSSQSLPGVTPAPGTNLTWDVSQMITNFLLKVTTRPYLTNGFDGTNFTFSWPEQYRGWRLERQFTNLTLNFGLSPYITNWVTIASSYGGTNLFYPDPTNNPYMGGYFRTVISVTTTNPLDFYRLVYP